MMTRHRDGVWFGLEGMVGETPTLSLEGVARP
jgi:hypothetical protein